MRLLIAVILPFLGVTSVLAQEKEDAAIVPLAVLGEMSVVRQTVIYNRLRQELSVKYALVSEIAYDQAEKEAFASLSIEQCTVAQCLRKIQELLQVDALFGLQVVTEDKFTQLTLSMVRSEKSQVVGDSCIDCTIVQLNDKVGSMARKLIGQPALPVAPVAATRTKPVPKKKRRWEDLTPAEQWDCDVHEGTFSGVVCPPR